MVKHVLEHRGERSMQHHRCVPVGPERALERLVVNHIPKLFGKENSCWVAGSVPIGAGMPDILIAEWQPDVLALKDADKDAPHVLAFLRHMRQARLDTIVRRLREKERRITQRLAILEQ